MIFLLIQFTYYKRYSFMSETEHEKEFFLQNSMSNVMSKGLKAVEGELRR